MELQVQVESLLFTGQQGVHKYKIESRMRGTNKRSVGGLYIMIAISRMTNKWTGICCCHLDEDPHCIPMGGFIITSSGDHKSSEFGVARLADMTVGYCGHTGIIVTSSLKNKSNTRGKAIVGSQVSGCHSGKVITGDTKHITG